LIPEWWVDLPYRRDRFWRVLLFEPGQGWLRWGKELRETAGWWDPPEPPESYVVAPPLRRIAVYLRWWMTVAWWLVCGGRVWHPYDREWMRLSWEEIRPSWSDVWDDCIDADRSLRS